MHQRVVHVCSYVSRFFRSGNCIVKFCEAFEQSRASDLGWLTPPVHPYLTDGSSMSWRVSTLLVHQILLLPKRGARQPYVAKASTNLVRLTVQGRGLGSSAEH